MIYDKILEGITVNLRSVIPDDAEITYIMRRDKEKTKFMHTLSGTIENQREYIIGQNKATDDYLFLVLDKCGKPIGMRSIYNVKGLSAESGRTIGYGDAFQNIEAIIIGYDFAFEILGIESIYMDAFADNESVRGIQKRVGAIEVERTRIDGWDCDNIRSVLHKENYYKNRNAIMNMIVRHACRQIRRDINEDSSKMAKV